MTWARAGLWGGLAVFLLFGLLVATGASKVYDLPIDHWMQRHVPAPANPPTTLGYLSIWGSQYATVPVVVVTVMGLLAMGAVRQAKIVSAVGFVGGLLILGLQIAFKPLVDAAWGGTGAQVVYPSGHTAGAAMAWGFAALFLLAARKGQRPTWVKPLLISVWVGLNAGVGLDRVLVRSHIVSDIVGGWGLGVALVAVAFLLDGSTQPARGEPA